MEQFWTVCDFLLLPLMLSVDPMRVSSRKVPPLVYRLHEMKVTMFCYVVAAVEIHRRSHA